MSEIQNLLENDNICMVLEIENSKVIPKRNSNGTIDGNNIQKTIQYITMTDVDLNQMKNDGLFGKNIKRVILRQDGVINEIKICTREDYSRAFGENWEVESGLKEPSFTLTLENMSELQKVILNKMKEGYSLKHTYGSWNNIFTLEKEGYVFDISAFPEHGVNLVANQLIQFEFIELKNRQEIGFNTYDDTYVLSKMAYN
jgi:hypothetical protein